jgi:hypothetical protein
VFLFIINHAMAWFFPLHCDHRKKRKMTRHWM